MTMKRYIFSEIQGNPTNDILAQGTLTVDNDNNLRLHDGTTNGGNIIGNGGNANTGNVTFSGATVIGDGLLNLAANTYEFDNGKYLKVRGGDQDSHIHFDTSDNSTYDLYLGDDSKYVRVARSGEIVIGVENAWEWNENSGKRWKFNTDGSLTVPGNIQSANNGDFDFTSTITGINLASNEVYINLTDSVFGGPETGQVAISGVVGTTEANGTWYYEATDGNQFRLYNDVSRSSPVDGSAWTAYVSGGLAESINQLDISIFATKVSIVAGTDEKTWTFNSDGTLTTPGYTLPATDGTAGQVLSTDGNGVVTWADAGTTTPVASYKGFKAIYGRMYGSEPTLSKLVIYKDSVSPTSSIDTSTNNDTFQVTGLTGSDIVTYFLLAGTDTSNPESLTTLQSFVEAAIDNVILVDGVEGAYRNAADMKTAFYNNYSALEATAGTLYNNFRFLNTVYLNITNNTSTLVQGSGASIALSDDGAGGYSVYNIVNSGTNYLVGHKLSVIGSLLGGTDGTNDAIITVTAVAANGVITSATATGTAFATAPAGGWILSAEEITNYNVGSGFVPYGLEYNPNNGTMGLNGWQNGNNYVVGDRIVILGSDIQNSNTSEYWASPANDVTITVTAVNGGSIDSYAISGTFPTMNGWPSNNINDGGDDQYDGGNYISTNLESDISYNGGDVASGSSAVGGGDYVAVYQDSIFGFFVSGADIEHIKTDGDSGFDGDGTADTGEIYGTGSTDTPTVITWTNPNNNIWRIEEYNGGASVSYNGSDYDAKWFDVANSTSGDSNFRGAIIQYHAYVQGEGNIIGTIHLANDYSQEAATHTEHLSGDSDLQFATLWQCNNERGQLYFKMTNGNSRDLLVQWTAKIFYGSENNC